MICGLVVAAAALAGQQATYLGRLDNRKGVMVATNEVTLRARSLATRDRDPKEVAQPVGVAVVARGTQARIVKPTLVEVWEDGGLKTIDGYQVEILEGPLAGGRGVVTARSTYRGESRELAPASPKEPKGADRVRLWLGGPKVEGVDLAVIVASSLDELAGTFILPSKPDLAHGVKMVDAPPMVAQLGYGTRAVGLGIETYQPKDDGPERSAALVKILDGPAAGRIVYVDGSYVHVAPDAQQVRTPSTRADELRRTAEKQKARRSARVLAGKAREAEDAAQVAKAEAEYRKVLPLLIERERVELEAMNQAQRNAYLQRMAKAAERDAAAAEYRAGMPRTIKPDGSIGAQ